MTRPTGSSPPPKPEDARQQDCGRLPIELEARRRSVSRRTAQGTRGRPRRSTTAAPGSPAGDRRSAGCGGAATTAGPEGPARAARPASELRSGTRTTATSSTGISVGAEVDLGQLDQRLRRRRRNRNRTERRQPRDGRDADPRAAPAPPLERGVREVGAREPDEHHRCRAPRSAGSPARRRRRSCLRERSREREIADRSSTYMPPPSTRPAASDAGILRPPSNMPARRLFGRSECRSGEIAAADDPERDEQDRDRQRDPETRRPRFDAGEIARQQHHA